MSTLPRNCFARHATRLAVGLIAVTSVVRLANAGPTSNFTGIPRPCHLSGGPSDLNLLDSGRGLRRIVETRYWRDETSPSYRSVFEFNATGQLIARESTDIKHGGDSWNSLEWKEGRLTVFESGSWSGEHKRQHAYRQEYLNASDGSPTARKTYDVTEDTPKRKPPAFKLISSELLFEETLPNEDRQCLSVSTDSARAMVNRYGRDGFWRNQTMIQLRAKPANNMDLALYMAPLLEKGYARTPTDANNINQWSANWDTPERHRMFAELRDGKLGNYILINDHNYLAEEGALSASGKRQPRDKYTYTYDDQGNWTEVVQNSHSNEKGWFVVFRYVRQNEYAAGPAGANRK